jgi:hypothetical protein
MIIAALACLRGVFLACCADLPTRDCCARRTKSRGCRCRPLQKSPCRRAAVVAVGDRIGHAWRARRHVFRQRLPESCHRRSSRALGFGAAMLSSLRITLLTPYTLACMAPCDPRVDGDCREHPPPRRKRMPLVGPDVRAAPASLVWVSARVLRGETKFDQSSYRNG